MILEQFYLACLSQASYLLGDEATGTGVVVDPRRDVDEYIERAKALGLRIEHVLLTHVHADFVAGHLELQQRTGARIHLGAGARTDFAYQPLVDGQVLQLGKLRIGVLATPGHTPESVCFTVHDLNKGDAPVAVLTGDTLFLGDVGRPDLMAASGMSARDLARSLHASLHDKLLRLPDSTLVYPGHGAGSACGKNLSQDRVSTLGAQRTGNCMLQPMDAHTFTERAVADLPPAPAYFARASAQNRQQLPTLAATLEQRLRPLTHQQLLDCQRQGMTVLDVRNPATFAAGFLPGSIHAGLDGRFASWIGALVDGTRPIVVIADAGREREAVLRLSRIGFDQVHGVLAAEAVAALGTLQGLPRLLRLKPPELAKVLAATNPPLVVDIREPGERAQNRIDGSVHIPLGSLAARAGELPRDRSLVLQCGSGYRSTIATTILTQHGFADLRDLEGGMAGWLAAFPPTTSPQSEALPRRSPEITMEPTNTTGIPRIGDSAPDFTAITTHGELTLSKWQEGKWVMLFSHPADFTPVCSTELTEFAKRSDEFHKRNTKLIGLSIDSVHSHLAWIENLKQILGTSIEYPMIADLDMKVAMAYGMLHPGASSTATVRSVFFIDPKRTIRALVYYPMNVGRNCDELLRLIDGLQMAEKHGCAMPVNWKPGDKVIVPPPKTAADVAERKTHAEYERIDFYLNKRDLPLDKLHG